jgi:hypothetical protein
LFGDDVADARLDFFEWEGGLKGAHVGTIRRGVGRMQAGSAANQ